MASASLSGVTGVRPSVWMADDDENFVELFKVACHAFSLEEVHCATAGDDLLRLLDECNPRSPYAVIFVDIRMEKEDAGFEVVEAIRRHPKYSLCPIIVMSSSLLQEDISRAARLGANSCFYKPTGTRTRVDAVQRHLEYWTTVATLPKLRSGFLEASAKSAARARGTAWYALDRLRQEILVALLNDIERQSAIDLSNNTKDVIRKALVRLHEVFDFRNLSFDEGVVESSRNFVRSLNDWLDAGEFVSDRAELLHVRNDIMSKAKSSRLQLSMALRKLSKSEGAQLEVNQLDYLIWDIFVELAYDPTFQNLYKKLMKFQQRAFS